MTARADTTTRAAGAVGVLAALIAGGIFLASGGRPAPDPLVDRASHSAGWRFAVDHQADPGPSGLPGGQDGTRSACQLWIDQRPTAFDRDDFLSGCNDATSDAERTSR